MYGGKCSREQFGQFLNAWRSYAETVRGQEEVIGKPLSQEQTRLLNDQQKSQLEQLEAATVELTTKS
jgi:hypothetical protein